jgi:hypothetical protein
VNVDVGDQTAAQIRAVHGENPGMAQEEWQNEADQQAQSAALWKQLASVMEQHAAVTAQLEHL